MKLTSILKEITVITPIQSFQELVARINSNPAFKPQLIDAIYDDANLTPETGWPNIKQEIIDGDIEINEMGESITLIGYSDGIMVSLKPFTLEDQEEFSDAMGSLIFQGAQFYYGLV
jgi:hypothetical protein